METRKFLYVIGTFIALLLSPLTNFAQCNSTSFGIDTYTVLSSQQAVTITPEISGMTYNDVTGEFVAIGDGGSVARRHPVGIWSAFGVNAYGGSHCLDNRFSDIEAITYISSNGGTHQYAIADERDRALVFVDISNTQTSLSHSSNYLKFSGLGCGGNNGIEGVAYDAASGKMFFATEHSEQKIYSFQVPSNISGQTVNVTEVVDLRDVPGLNTYSTHALDILPNGNIVALVTIPGNGDNGAFARMLVEFNQCGDMLAKMNVQPTISNSAELEGVAVQGNDIYLIGEFGVFYKLTQEAPPSIQVITPGTQGSFTGGSNTQVNWISTNVTGNVEIELRLNGNFISTLKNSTSNDGSELVTLPNINTNTSGYTIRVISKNDTAVFGGSSDFSITVPGTIMVVSPSTGDMFTVGSPMAITWTSQGLSGNLTLELYKGGAFQTLLATNTSNDGLQSVLIPNLADGADYRVRAVSANNGTINDFSGFFSINNPSITVTQPTANPVFSSGDDVTVEWQTAGISGNMKIELFKGGNFITSLANVTTNDGIESVTLPNVNATASDYEIKVTSLVNPMYTDFSGVFAITMQQVFELTNPTGGDMFGSGTYIDVLWNSTYGGTVAIELYKGNTLSTVLTSSTADDGVYTAMLPTVNATATDYSIRLINREDQSVVDFSSLFTITQQDFINVVSPTLNESFFTDNPITINWNSNIGGNVKIDLYENGALINTFSNSTPNDNSETFIIPANLVGGNDCTVRVSSLSNPSVTGESNAFQISSPLANNDVIDLTIQSAGTASQTNGVYSVNGITVINQGSGPVNGSYSLGAYLSIDQNITFSDFRIGTVDTYSNTGAGMTESSSISFDASSLGLANGNYYFGLVVDEFDDQSESDEFNNGSALVSPLVSVIAGGGGGNNSGTCDDIANTPTTEGFEQGLGNWTQASDDDMEWTRTNASTPSFLTGPTAASEGNFFLFTESSNGNRNKTARLIGSCIDLSNTVSPRLTLDYHMYGASTGTLQVNIMDQSGKKAVVFFQSGDQGDSWYDAAISLSSYIGQDITIEIEATVGHSYRSDIGIDNVRVNDTQGCSLVGTSCDDGDVCTIGEKYDIDCNCTGGVFTDLDQDGVCAGNDIDDTDACLPVAGDACTTCVSTVNGAFSEFFEGSTASWSQSTSDNNQWKQYSGSTPSSKTGPSAASQGSNYMYVEASHGGYPFKKAIMNSVCIDLSPLSDPELSFDYNMYGSSMGSLLMYVIDMADGTSTQVFNQAGNQGEDWRTHYVNLSAFANKTIQIKIEAITGFGFRSDIAIDNISVANSTANLRDEAETRNFVELASVDKVEELIVEELAIYPVPAVNYFTVEYQSADESESVNFSLVNTAGQTVKTQILQLNSGLVEEKIQLAGLPTGTYYATVQSDSSKISKQVLIVK